MDAALRRMKAIPEDELHFYLVQRDTLQATSASTRKAITFAQAEFERRAFNQTRSLTIMTTIVSGAIGLVGVVLGAYLTS